MIKTDKIDVYLGQRHVGTLAETKHRAAFQYSDEWIDKGFSISPFSLPLERRLFVPEYNPFEGVFGVFSDTLPDGWGRLVVDRYIRRKFHVNIEEVSGFQRLMLVSDSGMGGLYYKPSILCNDETNVKDYDELAEECKRLLEEENVDDLDELFKLGGSSGGARPKIQTKVDGEDWIIKFPASHDKKNIGLEEYEYSLCAKECGIEMSETRLFESKICEGYFGTKRFDRKKKGTHTDRIHMISASGLLETSHRYPNLDYHQMLKLTMLLTGNMQEVEKMFDLMCFNVFAHNRDDHSKNFSFLYKEDENRWIVSPAYDLTYSSSRGGEHATTIDGEGKSPGLDHILRVARQAGLDVKRAKIRAKGIEEIIKTMLRNYL